MRFIAAQVFSKQCPFISANNTPHFALFYHTTYITGKRVASFEYHTTIKLGGYAVYSPFVCAILQHCSSYIDDCLLADRIMHLHVLYVFRRRKLR